MNALGALAFNPQLTAEYIFRGAAEIQDEDVRDMLEEFASDLITIQGLPVFTGART